MQTYIHTGSFYLAFLCLISIIPFNVHAEVLDLNTALQNTYRACVDIDENLHDLKVLAGVNTAVTGVGTGLGVGATATGFVKTSKDALVEELEKILNEIKIVESNYPESSQSEKDIFIKEYNTYLSTVTNQAEKYESELEKLNKQSKKLGNWRTGLLAGNTATNIAGAVISSQTIKKDDLDKQIENCNASLKELNNAMLAAKLSGADISEAKEIYEACRDYEFVDISPIIKRGKGAMISSSVGAVVGGVGTITSGVANSDKIRDDNSEAGKEKEKNLNTASNVLSVGATAASATATVFNATQIAAIKKVANVSEKCTGVLK